MKTLLLVGIKKLADKYGEFFRTPHRDVRQLKKVSGKNTYRKRSPPWLLHNVIFVYDYRNDMTISYIKKTLPRKNVVREKGNNPLVCALLVKWMDRVRGNSDTLREMLNLNKLVWWATASTVRTGTVHPPVSRPEDSFIPQSNQNLHLFLIDLLFLQKDVCQRIYLRKVQYTKLGN